jgi:SAM-dependent methyltransferase
MAGSRRSTPMSKDYSAYSAWKGWEQHRFGKLDRSMERYFTAELQAAGIKDSKGLRIFEIGFGNGEFAAYATARGAQYVGMEINQELVATARSVGIEAHGSVTALDHVMAPASLNLVVAFDVFEHLSHAELERFLVQTRTWLVPGGLVLARIPSGDSPFSRAIQHGDLTHQLTLGSAAVRQLAVDVGLELIQARPPILPVCGNGPISAIRRLFVLAAQRMVYAFISLVLMGGGQHVLTPNMIFVMRRN